MQVFKSTGNIIAPLIVSLFVVNMVDWRPFAFGSFSILLAFLAFLILIFVISRGNIIENKPSEQIKQRNVLIEFHLWEKLGKLLRPILIIAFYYNMIDAFFWTLIPIYAESSNFQQFGGLFLAAYSLPALITGWFIGSITEKFGKKKTAYASLFTGPLILLSFFFIKNPVVLVISVFLASCFIKMTHPVINSSIADYVSDAPLMEMEIESLEDFALNIGYIFGPISAGVLADLFGIQNAFGILGLIGAVLAALLLIFGPKHIIINPKPSEL